MATHIDIARTEGAKAGFRAYVGRLARYAEGTAQAAKLDEILAAGNAKAQFGFYCALFGDKFADGVNVEAVEDRSREQQIEALLNGALDEDDDDDAVGVEVEDVQSKLVSLLKGKKSQKASPKAKKAQGVGIGTTFLYKGNTRHTIVGEGKTKHGRVAWIARNENGRDKAWNKKSLAIYIEQGKVTLA